MSRIEHKYCLITTSYLAGLFDISYYFIFDRIVCVLLTFYQWGHFVMLIMRNLNLISVQSLTHLLVLLGIWLFWGLVTVKKQIDITFLSLLLLKIHFVQSQHCQSLLSNHSPVAHGFTILWHYLSSIIGQTHKRLKAECQLVNWNITIGFPIISLHSKWYWTVLQFKHLPKYYSNKKCSYIEEIQNFIIF